MNKDTFIRLRDCIRYQNKLSNDIKNEKDINKSNILIHQLLNNLDQINKYFDEIELYIQDDKLLDEIACAMKDIVFSCSKIENKAY